MESSYPNNKYRIQKSPFDNHHSNNCYRQQSSMAAKTMGKNFMINTLKVTLHKLLNYKMKNNNFPVEKPGRYHLKLVIKISITTNKTTYPDMMH